ncbi:hypothetical protein QNH98_16375 [Myroides sp. mNGS23_01]|nr:hypothetical protein [Myroides sp. mNGS23_01]WHT38560.1 hypothetical protein QNH98_16375 [Myroides sp. mNGS23_01]
MVYFFYFKRIVAIRVFVTLLYLGSLYFLIYYQLVFLLVLFLLLYLVIGFDFLMCEWRNCYLAYKKKPILEIKEDYFIDHRLNLIIHWKDVSKVEIKHLKSDYHAVVYQLKNEDIIKRQLQKVYQKWRYNLLGATWYSAFHLVQIKTTKNELFECMEQYRKKANK